MLAIEAAMPLDVGMSISEYKDREAVANNSYDFSEALPGVDVTEVIRVAGNAAVCEDFVLTSGANPNKQHGPRSAIYTVAVISPGSGIRLNVAKFLPYQDGDAATPQQDQATIKESVGRFASEGTILDRDTFTLAHSITLLATFQRANVSVPSVATELRVSPDASTYVSLLVPTYLRRAPNSLARYIMGMKREGRQGEVSEAIKEMAYDNDRNKVARRLALSGMYHVLSQYDEQQKINQN